MMLRILSLLTFIALPIHVRAEATITGRVRLPPAGTPAVVAQRYEIVNHEGVIRINPPTAVVYLEGQFGPPATQPVAEVVQKDLTFEPSLLPIRVGTRVEFPNHDDTFHNVFSFSPAKRFDLGRYKPNEEPVPFQIFDKAGAVTLRCEIHQHMRALILVLDTPHFVRTETDGTFMLRRLPAGTFTLKAWVDSKTTYEKKVDLVDGATVEVSLP